MSSNLREQCHCGHDKTTHYLDHDVRPPRRGTCLAVQCPCRGYVNEFDPKPAELKKRPNHPSWCKCFDCKAANASSVLTPIQFDTSPPSSDPDTLPPTTPRWP